MNVLYTTLTFLIEDINRNTVPILNLEIKGYIKTLKEVEALGGKIEFGGKVIEREGNFVEPTIVTGLAHDAPGQFSN